MYENTFDFEDRVYLNPETSRNEQLSFLDTYRNAQAKNNQQIATENYNLGTPISSNLGGLGGGAGEVWRGQYQRPQTNLAIANLTSAAQQTALNQALTNYQNMLQNRYNQAKRRAYNTPSSTTINPGDTASSQGDVDFQPNEAVARTLLGLIKGGGNSVAGTTMVTEGGGNVWTSNASGKTVYSTQPGATRYTTVTNYPLPAGYSSNDLVTKRDPFYGGLFTKGAVYYYDRNTGKKLPVVYDLGKKKFIYE